MTLTVKDRKPRSPPQAEPWHGLPPQIRALYIATRQRTGGWLAEAFAADSACEVMLEEVVGMPAGLARLRDDAFDAVLVSHEPQELDALDLVEGYRAGGAEEPIIVLGTQSEQEMAALCHEVGADAYVCVHTATTRNLIWIIARAIQRHQLLRENRRLTLGEHTRLQREHAEAERLLQQQRAMLSESEPLPDATPAGAAAECSAEPPATSLRLPGQLIDHYRELLRTYVIMGSGNLTGELARLAEGLVAVGVGATEMMRLHLHVLEELIHGLGARSTRHVMTRADLLVLEVMMRLAEGYRCRYRERVCPPQQLRLPGIEGR